MRKSNLITRLLFPEKCLLCGKLLQKQDHLLCHQCSQDAPDANGMKKKIPMLSGSCALWYYEDHVRHSLLRFKFWRRRSYALGYGWFLAQKLQNVHQRYDLITWVPVSRRRKLKRGFDQVELIAHALCRELQVPPVPCLKKIRHNPPQASIPSAAQRRANVLGVYKVRDPELVAGKRILLLDDIITTGATISECAKMLMASGAKEVYGVAVAATRQYKSNQ